MGQVTSDYMAHAHCLLDTEGYKQAHVVKCSLLFHCNIGCTDAPECCFIRTCLVLLASGLACLPHAVINRQCVLILESLKCCSVS